MKPYYYQWLVRRLLRYQWPYLLLLSLILHEEGSCYKSTPQFSEEAHTPKADWVRLARKGEHHLYISYMDSPVRIATATLLLIQILDLRGYNAVIGVKVSKGRTTGRFFVCNWHLRLVLSLASFVAKCYLLKETNGPWGESNNKASLWRLALDYTYLI